MPEITLDNLKAFFANLPTIASIEKEAGLPKTYLNKIMKKEKPLTQATINKLRPVLAKYKF